jgi:hypothetical protein
MNRLKVSFDGPGRGTVELDGRDISGMVVGVSTGARVGEFPLAVLELRLHRGADVDGLSIVRLAPETAELLTALGWKPPVEK